MESNAHRSRSISDVSSFSTVSVLSFYDIRVRALRVQKPQLGCIGHVSLALENEVKGNRGQEVHILHVNI